MALACPSPNGYTVEHLNSISTKEEYDEVKKHSRGSPTLRFIFETYTFEDFKHLVFFDVLRKHPVREAVVREAVVRDSTAWCCAAVDLDDDYSDDGASDDDSDDDSEGGVLPCPMNSAAQLANAVLGDEENTVYFRVSLEKSIEKNTAN